MRAALGLTLFCLVAVAACSGGDSRKGGQGRGLPIIDGVQHQGSRLIGRMTSLGRGMSGARGTGRLCGIRGIEGQRIPPITSEVEGCGLAQPVRVTHVDGLRLSQPAIMDCETAAALHRWVRKGVRPAVGRAGGGAAGLRVAAHYACRPRNHQSGARVSEHGRGRAIDISAIELANGQEMNVLQDWHNSTHSRALRQMHRAACGTFGTTLGPGSDGLHEDHFHYDTARHRGGPYCR